MAVLFGVLAFVLGLAVVAGWVVRGQQASGRRWLSARTRPLLTVHTSDDQTIEGLLQVAAADGLVLAGARLLRADGPLDLGGQVFVPAGKVVMVQRH